MPVPHLYRQLQVQLSQWINPQDQRHLQVFCENVAAILQAQSACLSHWLPYLSHRDCQACSHMERLNYFVHNPKITSETFYFPLLRQFLQGWEGTTTTLTLDTSMLWDQYCLRAGEAWAVLTDVPPSLQTFAVYSQRFGGVEPHFKDYKSAGFELIRSHLRGAQALNCLLMLLAAATLIAILIAVIVSYEGRRKRLDWHSQRGLSFLQLGLRELERLCYQH